MNKESLPARLILFSGADCSQCDTYQQFLAGHDSGLVNPDSDYRCCWLPREYPRGTDCPIRLCCEEKGIWFCGECRQFEACASMKRFYSQPGYDALRNRMLEETAKRRSKST